MAAILMCTNCGNEQPHIERRPRHPGGYQAFYSCLDCGARNWEDQMGADWACIKWVAVKPAVTVVPTPTGKGTLDELYG